MLALFVCLLIFAILSLGSLLTIRRKDGSIKPEGLLFFAVFMVGMLATLVLIVTG